ncbi:MAG: hypothetical protein P4M01_10710 [Acidobacteriota bacterium]|nr:hypothetical protein [Acidobacteriota bacterium]
MAKRFALVMALLLIMAAATFAQVPSAGNVFVGYSLARVDAGWGTQGNINGWEVSAEGKVAPFVGMVLDLGTTYGPLPIPNSQLFGTSGMATGESTLVTYMVGPRVSVKVGRFRPFAHVLVGGAHLHQNVTHYADAYVHGETALADDFGGGVDYRIMPHIGFRLQGDALQTRFRDDYPVNTGVKTNIRGSAGIVFNF